MLFLTHHVTTQELVRKIDLARTKLKALRPIEDTSILASLLLVFTHGSVTLEGNTLTLEETQVMSEILSSDPSHDPTDIDIVATNQEKQEMANHLLLVQKFSELVRIPLSEPHILNVHRLLMQDIMKVSAKGGPGMFPNSSTLSP